MSVGGLTQAQWQERLSVESTKALHGQGRRDMSAERRLILALTPRSQLSEQLSTLSKTISMPQLPALPPRERPAVRWISSHEPIYTFAPLFSLPSKPISLANAHASDF